MIVKIEYKDGSSITFTNVQDFKDNDVFITFTGVEDPPGTASTDEKFDWADVRRVSKRYDVGSK
ncbi:hypothetical protein IAI21_11035 [Streptococcus pseudopneumoniae]|nr:hypothetical protein [Streptococcus pseudopneumoniae]